MNTLIVNRSLKIALVFALIQQILVALSTYFIAMLAQRVAEGDATAFNGIMHSNAWWYLLGFVVCLIVVYVPAYFASVFLQRAKFDALFAYTAQVDSHFYGKSVLFNDPNKDTFTALVSQESKLSLDDSLDFLFDFVSLGLNITLNLLVLVTVIDTALLWAYLFGSVLALLVVRLGKSTLSGYAHTAQTHRIALLSTLSNLWDNAVLGNRYNHTHFSKKQHAAHHLAKTADIKSVAMNHLFANLGMLSLMLPVLGLIVFLFIQQPNPAQLALLVATLPRQIQMLQMAYSLIGHLSQIAMVKARLTGLMALFDNKLPTPDYLDKYIDPHAITIAQTGQSLADFNLNHLPKTGLLTLTGDNGTGKSCFLLKLKQLLGEKAYYLPVQHHLAFAQSLQTLSTGQKLIHALNELIEHSTAIEVLLLDEWDANLDSTNRNQLAMLIQSLTTQCLVIEIRHRF